MMKEDDDVYYERARAGRVPWTGWGQRIGT